MWIAKRSIFLDYFCEFSGLMLYSVVFFLPGMHLQFMTPLCGLISLLSPFPLCVIVEALRLLLSANAYREMRGE